MTDTTSHLTEEERQTLADGSMPAERVAMLQAHLGRCAECAADVARLQSFQSLMKHTDTYASAHASLEELWPAIRSRIEQNKLVALPSDGARVPVARVRHWSRTVLIAATLAAAAAAVIMVAVRVTARQQSTASTTDIASTANPSAMVAVSDSVHSYEQEAQILLNRLELQRAVLRPEAAASIDRDLKVIDQAIDELKVAIANDPRNPALRQLLASSYRQKVDLLKRAGNAS